ncbi:hypothetical protein EMIHUDRAFT_250928 [Emiliania huxleyi CCMP1516]|uniref:Protein NO VEIN C-terminal domain-containing protein n=2 Tax=Emiliania huxleyi TaxID=2903 RepID=A0A0D3KZ98_EMIH1|nr:hypothetical protein EMIHUDRAFT_250928 [Emiliania huxleyi CCMP1516]EOD41083.1 hypothetical protein EMIHUDRAFT_250928 [Emiliania huxleyi CCMP1516]|eukprot:XP_005793512.1 hypothetical protein EMIHUDRAFT_250928 [Emiliania huxleyi CCMP1516]
MLRFAAGLTTRTLGLPVTYDEEKERHAVMLVSNQSRVLLKPSNLEPWLVEYPRIRQRQLASGDYLDVSALKREAEARLSLPLPPPVAEALRGLQRVLSAVNSVVTLALATHNLLTLPLLDELIRLNRDFAAVASFDELLLGPLHRNPHVQRGAQRLSDATEAAGFGRLRQPPPPIGVDAIMEALSRAARAAFKSRAVEERVDFRAARGALGGGLPLGVPPRDDDDEEEGDEEEDRNRVGGSSEQNMSVAAALTVLANAQQTLHRALSRAHESARWAHTTVGQSPHYAVLTLLHLPNTHRKMLHRAVERKPGLGFRTLSTGPRHQSREGGTGGLHRRMLHLLPATASAEQLAPLREAFDCPPSRREESRTAEEGMAAEEEEERDAQARAEEGAGRRCEPALLLEHLCGVLEALQIEAAEAPLLETVAAAEARLLERLDAAAFEELLPGSSFASFLGAHAAPLGGRPTHARPLGSVTAADALRALRCAPDLADLSEATLWDDVFAAELGPLREFVQRHSRELAEGAVLLEAEDGRFVRLSAPARVSALREAAALGDGRTAAAVAAALCVEHGSVRSAPIELLRDQVQRACAGGGDQAARFVLEAVAALPPVLQAPLGLAVFLDPFCAEEPDAWRSLLASASPVEVRALYRVGAAAGISLLTEHFARSLYTPSAASPPPPSDRKVEGAASSAASSGGEGREAASASDTSSTAVQSPSLDPADASADHEPTAATAVTCVSGEAGRSADSAVRADGSDRAGGADEADATSRLCDRVGAMYGASESEASGPMRELRGITTRAIHRLAEELYAGSAHFVLELVQNADDNDYPAGVVPELRVEVTPAAIRFFNNEAGFSEANALALCSIGRSTKRADDPRYIGNKGIGWKSVFKITPRPQVHSRGFRLAFDATDASGLGYIVPRPAEPLTGWDGRGTVVLLPLEAAGGGAALRELRVALSDLRPSLLLFLRQLRSLEVRDAALGLHRRTTRRQHATDPGRVLLEESLERDGHAPSTQTQEWLVVTRRLDAAAERLGNQSTEVAIAFPLVEPSSPLPALDVFAFLPLRSYGMRFLLQADWVLPSSRESVDASSAWNQWLRSCVPDLFVEAAAALLQRAGDEQEKLRASNLLLQLVPTGASEFFEPLAKACCRRLKSVRFLLTRGGEFVTPGEAVVAGSSALEEASAPLATDRLVAQIGLHPAHPSLSLPAELARHLGVRRLDASLAVELLAELSSGWSDAGDVDTRWPGTWQRSDFSGAHAPGSAAGKTGASPSAVRR